MGNSDSDSENECFESAEESLDENEEAKSVGTKARKSANEVAEPVFSNTDSTPQVEKDISGNSMSYRKRPDRVRRTSSNSTMKRVLKPSSTDAIFKPEKIVADAFFQDITSNLSKNINKSLSTLQQKSSNVKDLILSSLPVSSANDDRGFSYDDDNTLQSLPDKIEYSDSEEQQSKDHSDHLVVNVLEERSIKEESYGNEKVVTEKNSPVVSSLSGSNEERKPPDIMNITEGKRSENDFHLNDNRLGGSTKEEINLIVNEKQDALNESDGNQSKEELECEAEKIRGNLVVSGSLLTSSSPTKVLQDEGANNNDIEEATSINLSHKIPITTAVELTKTELEDSEQNSDHSEFLSRQMFDESKLISSKPHAQHKEGNGNFIKNYLSNFQEEKTEVDLKCNIKELKTALESIVQDKTSNSNETNEKNEISESEFAKEYFTSKEEKVNQSSSDGWDDFDFSDEEVENIKNKSDIRTSDFKESALDNKSSSADSNTSLKPKTGDGDKITSKADLIVQDRNTEVPKNPKREVESETIYDDTWDWDDNWNEAPEDKKEMSMVSSKPEDKIYVDSSDISKWTGWDTFAQKPQEKQTNWGLGSWGVDMLLNKATAVTQGISNVLEAGLGAPDPETLARMQKLEREKLREDDTEETPEYSEAPKKNSLTNVTLFPVSGITSLVAGVTSKIVEHSKIQEISSKVITGGLDTLETFGKKTMEVLQEGDPGLKNKRALLMGDNKPVLSQVLREAREKAEREMKKAEEKEMAKKCHFETLFDDFQGMVHLEALEMLSKQCQLKLEQIKSGMNSEEQEDLDSILEEVEQLCALDECELDLKSSLLDFKTALTMAVEPLKNEISIHKIIQIYENVNKWLEMSSEAEPSLCYLNQKLVSTLAELAAATVQQFHKSGELLSVKECRKTVEEADALSRLTNILCSEMSRLCEKFILLFQKKDLTAGGNDNLNSMTENVTVVMKNSTLYIRQAFDLLIPVLQLGAAV